MQELNTTQPIGWFIEAIVKSMHCDRPTPAAIERMRSPFEWVNMAFLRSPNQCTAITKTPANL
jgi:hypothetical protein